MSSRLTFAFFGYRGRTSMKERKSKKWLHLLEGDFLPDHNLLATEEIKSKRKKNPIKRQSLYLRSVW